ncbi:MAG: ATP-binding cassette domain-containing protein [Marinilabiliales bacterium]|nr:MAG: ATP-binding cassette domain-containing protein [Marinilabiliales bacterium]
MDKIIDVQRLYAEIDGNEILSDVSFCALEGEVTAIIGGSGSGKTTVLKHLLGLYPVSRGYVSVLGRSLAELTEKEQRDLYLEMGVLYQDGALLNSMTVAENIALPLRHQGNIPEALTADIVRMKLRLVNLEDTYYLYPSQLSGGMLKRAALARAIAMDPPLLFCDEPGAGLDPASLESLDNLILNLKNLLGISVILVTHEVSSIVRTANRIVYLDNGRVLFEGSTDQALKSEIPQLADFFSVIRKKQS